MVFQDIDIHVLIQFIFIHDHLHSYEYPDYLSIDLIGFDKQIDVARDSVVLRKVWRG